VVPQIVFVGPEETALEVLGLRTQVAEGIQVVPHPGLIRLPAEEPTVVVADQLAVPLASPPIRPVSPIAVGRLPVTRLAVARVGGLGGSVGGPEATGNDAEE